VVAQSTKQNLGATFRQFWF